MLLFTIYFAHTFNLFLFCSVFKPVPAIILIILAFAKFAIHLALNAIKIPQIAVFLVLNTFIN